MHLENIKNINYKLHIIATVYTLWVHATSTVAIESVGLRRGAKKKRTRNMLRNILETIGALQFQFSNAIRKHIL